LKSNDEESQDLVPVTIHCLEKKEELGLVTIEINELESSDVYGCPDFNYLDDPIKVINFIPSFVPHPFSSRLPS
jgi:hypothetical protein